MATDNVIQPGAFSNPSQEAIAIAYMMESPERLSETLHMISEGLLTDWKLKDIYNYLHKYYRAYGGVLQRTSLEVMMERDQVVPERKEVLLMQLDDLQRLVVAPDEFLMAKDELKTLATRRSLYQLANDIADKVSKQPEDKLIAEVVQKALDATGIVGNRVMRVSYKDNAQERLAQYVDRKEHPEKYRGIPYGFAELDSETGGMFKQETTLIFGGTGAGKSRTFVNIAAFQALVGKHALYITIEMSRDAIARLLDSRLMQLSSRGLKRASLSEADEKKYFAELKNVATTFPGDVTIADYPMGLTPDELVAEIRQQKKVKPIDVVIIDYLNLMKHPRKELSREETLAQLATELHAVARLEDIPIVTGAQAVGDLRKQLKDAIDHPDTSLVGYSRAICHPMSLVLLVDQGSSEEQMRKLLNLYIIKGRDIPLRKLQLHVDFDKSFIGDFGQITIGGKAISNV